MPGRLTLAFWPDRIGDLLARANFDPQALLQARIAREVVLAHEGARLWTLLTYAFLHGSWVHVGLNSIWIVAFGPPVARRLGAWRFLVLFAATAIAGKVQAQVFIMSFTQLCWVIAAIVAAGLIPLAFIKPVKRNRGPILDAH